MRKEDVIKSIRKLSQQVMPVGTQVILFGSQARNEAHSQSDWDVLILLNKNERANKQDFVLDVCSFSMPFYGEN